MKKAAGLMLLCVLIVALLAGCSNGGETVDASGQSANFVPEQTVAATDAPVTATPESVQPEVMDIPLSTEDPGEPAVQETSPEGSAAPSPSPTAEPSASYTFEKLSDPSFGFVFEYPSEWENLPGKYTVCFREPVEEGDVPARVAVTKKTLAHTPNSSTLLKQFQSYFVEACSQYDPSTLELGSELNSEASFMGQKAYEITYLAYSGETEVKGYMICCSIERSVYVFHFSSSYADYSAMSSLMTRMRDSVAVVE